MVKGVVPIFLIIAASILTVSIAGSWEEVDELETIHVAGKVLCQDCTQGWNEWINGAKPINGSKVSITCLDDRSRVMYYGSDLTDNIGYFELFVKKYVYGKKVNPTRCFLRLVSSPDPVCNILTDFSGGKSGVKLARPTMMYRDIIKYVLGPFYYTTPMCDEPDTTVNETTQYENENETEESGENSEDGNESKY